MLLDAEGEIDCAGQCEQLKSPSAVLNVFAGQGAAYTIFSIYAGAPLEGTASKVKISSFVTGTLNPAGGEQ